MRESLLIALTLFPLAVLLAAEPERFRLPQGDDVYFRNYRHTGSDYLHFAPDGSYRLITREHRFVEVTDHGTWSQDGAGELALVSRKRYRDIELPPLSVRLLSEQDVQGLPRLKVMIGEALASSVDAVFTTEQIARIGNDTGEDWASPISMELDVEEVPRAKLVELAQQIGPFLKDPQKNCFRVIPIVHRGHTVLFFRDAGLSFQGVSHLRGIEVMLDELDPAEPLAHVFAKIDGKTFRSESQKTQPFVYYPELNRCVPQPGTVNGGDPSKAIDGDEE